jgi:hypothetical protein
MLPPLCPNCGCAANGPTLHGTVLVLCPVCWTVVDPTAPLATLPVVSEPRWTLTEVGEPEAVVAIPPHDHSPLDFSRLPPCPRPTPSHSIVAPTFLLLIILLLVALPAGYGMWLIRTYYPSFEDTTDASGQIQLAFPGSPYWQPARSSGWVDEPGPSAYFTRRYRGQREEVYSLQVLRATGLPQAAANPAMFALEKATKLAGTPYSPQSTRPRIVSIPGYACADFERVNWLSTPTTTTAGRVILAGEYYYILTVTGPDVTLRDWRVQRFFNSFRLTEHAACGCEAARLPESLAATPHPLVRRPQSLTPA